MKCLITTILDIKTFIFFFLQDLVWFFMKRLLYQLCNTLNFYDFAVFQDLKKIEKKINVMLINLFCYQNSLYHKNSFCLKFKWHRERRQNLDEKSVLNLLTKFQNSQHVLHYCFSSPVWKIVTVANIYCIVVFAFDFE